MSTEKTALKNHYLNEDLIIGILSKLPVKSLIRFQCVSKSWNDLTKSPRFVDMHLNRSKHTNNDHKDHLVWIANNPSLRSNFIFFLPYETFDVYSPLSIQVNPSTLRKYICFCILGSCNGLLCVWSCIAYYVVNPATRECKEIVMKTMLALPCSCGFGFDPKTNDYKLVTVLNPTDREPYKAEVFSLRNNSWTSYVDIDRVFEGVKSFKQLNGAVVKNVVHWRVNLKAEIGYKHVGIARFDLVDEVFKDIIGIPASLQCRRFCRCAHHCYVVKDCLSMAAFFEDNYIIEVWVMKEYGVEGSWTKLYCFGVSHILKDPSGSKHSFEVGICGDVILHENRRVLILRPSSGEHFDIIFDRLDDHFDSHFADCRESLVQISRD